MARIGLHTEKIYGAGMPFFGFQATSGDNGQFFGYTGNRRAVCGIAVNYNSQEIAKMATRKARPKARVVRKSAGKNTTSAGKVAGLDLGRLVEDIKIGKYSLEDMLKSSSKNVSAIAEANRAIIDGYTDIAKRQYEMLKGMLRELRKVRGDRDVVVKELKRLIERAKKDMHVLQKIASRANSKAQGIVRRRAEANIKAWRKLVAEARTSVGGKLPAMEMPTSKKKAAPKKKVTARKKVAPRKKATPGKKAPARKKAAPKRKTAARKRG